MGDIVLSRRHRLGLAGAKRLAESMARRLKADYGGSYSWSGDTLTFERTGVSGQVAVTRDNFEVRLGIGWLLAPLQSRIERELHAFCEEHFGPASADADQPSPLAQRSGADGDQPSPVARRSGSTKSSRSQGTPRSVRPK